MNWFEKLCHNTGLMIHNVVKPLKKSDKQVVKKTVDEEQVDETTILRRTTIEEIEIRKGKGTTNRDVDSDNKKRDDQPA